MVALATAKKFILAQLRGVHRLHTRYTCRVPGGASFLPGLSMVAKDFCCFAACSGTVDSVRRVRCFISLSRYFPYYLLGDLLIAGWYSAKLFVGFDGCGGYLRRSGRSGRSGRWVVE
jgi:hypothetical protein